MADTIILNLSAMDRHILDLVDGKSSALEILIKNLSKIEGISAKVALFPSQGDDTLLSEVKDLAKKSGFQPLQPQNEGSLPLLQALSQSGCLKGGLCYWFEGDAPFYDLDLVQKMVQNHRYYGVQFSNGDGYPEGLVPEIWNAEILPALIKLAEHEKVDIRKYNIIYDAVADIKAAMEGMLAPELSEETLGTAEVREVFKVPKIGLIAGCYVKSGKVRRNENAHVIRDGVIIHSGKITSLKRFKDDAKEVDSGFECGIGIENYLDVQVGDEFEVYVIKEIARNL